MITKMEDDMIVDFLAGAFMGGIVGFTVAALAIASGEQNSKQDDDGNFLLMQNDDGTWGKYDDTWDISIHCTSEKEHERAVKILQAINPIQQIVKEWAEDLEEKSEGDYYMKKIEDLLKAEDEKK